MALYFFRRSSSGILQSYNTLTTQSAGITDDRLRMRDVADITMNDSEAREGRIPDAVKAFVAALHMLGITTGNTIYTSVEVPPGTIDIVVGPR